MLGEATLDVSGTFAGEAIRLLILFAAPQDCALNHVPAVVDLGHNPIGFVLAVQRDCGAGPFGRRISGD